MADLPAENVRDYPRPPAVEPVAQVITLCVDGQEVAETSSAWRVCETFHPPVYYLPAAALAPGLLRPAPGTSVCEWKGRAIWFDVIGRDGPIARGAWSYPEPVPAYGVIAGHLAFYLSARVTGRVGGVAATPQPGRFYGGWVTPNLTGPVKGAPGTLHW